MGAYSELAVNRINRVLLYPGLSVLFLHVFDQGFDLSTSIGILI